MPVHQYKCEECDHEFEKLFKTRKAVEVHPACPRCESEKTEKQLAASNLRFVGSGFYSTDYK